jgi:enamine deaminase RidA (YjgF/YER057c/UK114 family)
MVSTGSRLEGEFAYARAVCQGEWCFVAGTTGYDYKSMEMPEAAVDQARNALATIETALTEVGFAMADVVRATYYIADTGVAREIGPALREAFGTVRPAATMLVAGLVAPEMKIEIEVTALRRAARDTR